MRAFIAVDVYHENLSTIRKRLEDTGAHIRFVEPHNSHVTLKFLGEIHEDKAEMICGVLEKVGGGRFPLDARIEGVGAFPSLNYIKVIWVGLWCEPLVKIQEELDDRMKVLGFRREKRYKPHLTIGRVKSSFHKSELKNLLSQYKDEFICEVTIDAIKLKKSDLRPEGPVYNDLCVVK